MMIGWLDGRMMDDDWMDGWKDGWVAGWMMIGWMQNGWIDASMNGWIDGRDGLIYRM